jgi:two-component system, OmpR family, alkaline phosphatase synthesis response regulator PhoP
MRPILIVKGDPETRGLLSRILKSEGLEVLEAPGVEDALSVSRSTSPGLLLVDGGDGMLDAADLLETLLGELGDAAPPAISLSNTENEGARARLAGASDDLRKPFSVERLLVAVRAHRRSAVPAP